MSISGSKFEKIIKPIQKDNRPKFIVADPGLRGTHGHHLETSLSFARGAQEVGYQVYILGGPGCSELPIDGTQIISWFSCSFYDAQPEFDIYATFDSLPEIGEFESEILLAAEFFELSKEDILFFHTSSIMQTYLSMMAVITLRPDKRFNVSHLFRYDFEPTGLNVPAGMYQLLRQMIGKHSPLSKHFSFYAETIELATYYTDLLNVDIEYLPHTIRKTVEIEKDHLDHDSKNVINIGVFGEARSEKGIKEALEIIEGVLENYSHLPIRFLVQTYMSPQNIGQDKVAADAVARIQFLFEGTHHKFFDYATDELYQELWKDVDIVLVLYRCPEYARRGSGIFAEGIVNNKIIFANPEMAMFKDETRIGVRSVTGLESFLSAYDFVQSNWQIVMQDVTLAGARQRSIIAPGYQVQKIKSAYHKPEKNSRPLAMHIAPLWKGQGSSHVFQAQVDYLVSRGYAVVCIVVITWKSRPINIIEYFEQIKDASIAGSFCCWMIGRKSNINNKCRQASFLLESLTARQSIIPSSLQSFCNVNKFEVAIVNYPHLLFVIDKLFYENRPKIIVETHDIRAEQYALEANRSVRPVDLALEYFHMSRSDGLVFISEYEREVFEKKYNHVPSVTAFPVFSKINGNFNYNEQKILNTGSKIKLVMSISKEKRFESDKIIGKLILFIGSAHTANIYSMEWFFVHVKPLIKGDYTLLLVGDICEAFGEISNVIKLGRVDDLSEIYNASDLVIIPIMYGTGLPIKLIDALVAKKPIVTTSYAVRGFGPKAECLKPCQDHISYADRIDRLLSTPQSILDATLESNEFLQYLSDENNSYNNSWNYFIEQGDHDEFSSVENTLNKSKFYDKDKEKLFVYINIAPGEVRFIENFSSGKIVIIEIDCSSIIASENFYMHVEGKAIYYDLDSGSVIFSSIEDGGLRTFKCDFSRETGKKSIVAYSVEDHCSNLFIGIRPQTPSRI